MSRILAAAALAALAGLAAAPGADRPAKPAFEQRWVYCAFNLQVKESADELIRLIERAAKSGYNGVVLADYKLNILDRVPDHYFANAARIRAAAERRHVEIIPCVFPIGYSGGLLAHDPNLAEGLPVKDAPFVVRGREAVPAGEPPPFRNGGLEEAQGDRFAGLSFQDDPGRTTFADREVHHGGRVSCRMQDPGQSNCRLAQRVAVRPWACYRYSAWVKTRDLKPAGNFRLLALGASGPKGTPDHGRPLTFYEGGVKPTQDWQQVEVVFNSLDQSAVTLYAGRWGGGTGTLWLDDLALEELSLVNVLRRPGCPLAVTSADGATVYEEGKDFLPVKDELLGRRPWDGEYDFRHSGAKIRLTDHSRIRDGERLRVSWFHPVVVHGEQVACCLTEPKVYDLLGDQARRVQKLFEPKTFFMSHDELRVAGWCDTCRKTGATPGDLLARNVSRCVRIIREVNPSAQVVVWSDMFDPHHNAVDHYYLVNGNLAGSWEGLPKDVTVVNWNGGKAATSLNFFADHGYEQIIAGYYDDGPDNFRRWREAARGVPRVRGFMYTTWAHRYEQLEEYGKLLTGAE